MEGLEFYYLIEFTPDNQKILDIDLSVDFPGLTQVVAGSDDFKSYEDATKHALQFLKSKLESLGEGFKIFFEKNQFDKQSATADWEENEVVKIYIANSQQTVYNSLFKARVFFTPQVIDQFASYFDAPITLQ